MNTQSKENAQSAEYGKVLKLIRLLDNAQANLVSFAIIEENQAIDCAIANLCLLRLQLLGRIGKTADDSLL